MYEKGGGGGGGKRKRPCLSRPSPPRPPPSPPPPPRPHSSALSVAVGSSSTCCPCPVCSSSFCCTYLDSSWLARDLSINRFPASTLCNAGTRWRDRLLASVGQDDDHTVGVYDWQNKKLKASACGDKNKSLAVAFSPDGTTVCQVQLWYFFLRECEWVGG